MGCLAHGRDKHANRIDALLVLNVYAVVVRILREPIDERAEMKASIVIDEMNLGRRGERVGALLMRRRIRCDVSGSQGGHV